MAFDGIARKTLRGSEAEYMTMLVLREFEVSWASIAAIYGLPSPGAARAQWNRLREFFEDPGEGELTRAPTCNRQCLSCGQLFESAGKGNRMCDPCREGSTKRSSWDIEGYSISPPSHIHISV